MFLRQEAIHFKRILKSNLIGHSPIESNRGPYLSEGHIVLLSTHSQSHVETGSQSRFQQIMRAETSVTTTFICGSISGSLVNTVGKDGLISCFIAGAFNYVRSPLKLNSPRIVFWVRIFHMLSCAPRYILAAVSHYNLERHIYPGRDSSGCENSPILHNVLVILNGNSGKRITHPVKCTPMRCGSPIARRCGPYVRRWLAKKTTAPCFRSS